MARNLWKELFTMYELVDIMRQKDEQIVQALFGFCLMILGLVGQHDRNTENYTTQALIQIGHLYLMYSLYDSYSEL